MIRVTGFLYTLVYSWPRLVHKLATRVSVYKHFSVHVNLVEKTYGCCHLVVINLEIQLHFKVELLQQVTQKTDGREGKKGGGEGKWSGNFLSVLKFTESSNPSLVSNACPPYFTTQWTKKLRSTKNINHFKIKNVFWNHEHPTVS